MKEIVGFFAKFFWRDLFHIFGGWCTATSIALLVNPEFVNVIMIEIGQNYIALVLLAIFCYVVGFATQELFSLLTIVRTGQLTRFPYPLKALYKIYLGKEFPEKCQSGKIPTMTEMAARDPAFTVNNPGLERTISLKSLASALGSNFLLSSVFIIYNDKIYRPFGISLLIISFVLILINRLKAMQVMEIIYLSLEKPSVLVRNTSSCFLNQSVGLTTTTFPAIISTGQSREISSLKNFPPNTKIYISLYINIQVYDPTKVHNQSDWWVSFYLKLNGTRVGSVRTLFSNVNKGNDYSAIIEYNVNASVPELKLEFECVGAEICCCNNGCIVPIIINSPNIIANW